MLYSWYFLLTCLSVLVAYVDCEISCYVRYQIQLVTFWLDLIDGDGIISP